MNEAARYDFTDLQIKDFWTKGYIKYKRPGKWYHNKKLKKTFYDEFFKIDLIKSVKKFKRPILIIHGEKDESLPVTKDPHELYKSINKPKRLVIIKGSDHSYTKPKHMREAILYIDRFIRKG